MKNKFLMSILLVGTLVMVTGCVPKHFKYDEYISYVDNMECNTGHGTTSCNLKGKYEVIEDNHNSKEKPYVLFKIKDTDLTFKVFRTVSCGSIDGTGCFNKKYSLDTNYQYNATDYYLKEYAKKMNNTYCLEIGKNCHYTYLDVIKTKKDLKDRVKYLEGFLTYINSLDIGVIDYLGHIGVQFDKNIKENAKSNVTLTIYFKYENDKYDYVLAYGKEKKYVPEDGKLITYIENYMKDKNIIVE